MTKDILDEMSKEELVSWVRQNVHHRPSHRALLYTRWNIAHKKQTDKEAAQPQLSDLFDVKEWNDLAEAFNTTSCHKERLKIAGKLDDMVERKNKYFKMQEANRKEWKRLDRLYAEMQKEDRDGAR